MIAQPTVFIDPSQSFNIAGAETAPARQPATLTDRVFRRLALNGASVGLLAELFGLPREAVEQRAATLGLPRPLDRPVRNAGPRGWTIETLRQFITLWCDNVATRSIAVAIGRSKGSLYAKRKRLGLEPRNRRDLEERSPEACAATPMSWLPRPLIDVVVKPIQLLAEALKKHPDPKSDPARQDRWTPERSKSCSFLAFAGLSNTAIANRMMAESGMPFTPQAVADRLSRLQAFRERAKTLDALPEDEIMARANAFIARWGMQWRICEGTGHHFWYSRVKGGPRTTCREFQRQKYRKQRQEREYAAHFGA
ncbi:hypothetical protein M2322_004472 [Rhodoblastus acidophilus]|uniref:hypothetical protein n=1 Tax=Rhodoblastus acidophilus TaxID=1074 RepID=UPI0022242FF1|nr:hypothetical protein [Rhodoblastus acidophilus]MCW2318903.1 hypothetical protein [Rhodoblastus acidophilus]